MIGILVAAAIVVVCNALGSVTALALTGADPEHKPRNEARLTCLYYALAVGILAGVIW